MKTLKLIALAAFALLFSQCKTTAPTAPLIPTVSIREVNTILDSTESKFLQYAEQTNGDPRQAIEHTANWLQTQPNVKMAYSTDSNDVTIVLNSGLNCGFYFDFVDGNGYSTYRGSGGSGPNSEHILSANVSHSKNTIDNKKVLIFASDTKTLYSVEPQIVKTISRLTNSGIGFNITTLRNEQCTNNIAEHFGDYGLVIISTHGKPDAFLLGNKLNFNSVLQTESSFQSYIDSQAGIGTYDKLVSGQLRLKIGVKVNTSKPTWWTSIPSGIYDLWFSSKYISQLPSMPNTVILGNMCYSGWSTTSGVKPSITLSRPGLPDTIEPGYTYTIDAIEKAFESRNPISYYCYALENGKSECVSDHFAAAMEDSIVRKFVEDFDSTGIAHLKANGSEYEDPSQPGLKLKHYGADDYSYVKCGDPFTDERDGQIYKTVCIGTQIWMAQNLNYNAPGSRCYENNSANCDTYGRLYDMKTMTGGQAPSNSNPSGVQGICPKGWHVPSTNEVEVLQSFLGYDAGGAMKAVSGLWVSPNIGATNSSGFSALPGGSAFDTSWSNLGQAAWFGTTSTIFTAPNNYWWIFGVSANSSIYNLNDALEEPPLNWYTSCRCVKDP